jgi:hypothetical protein
MQGELRIDPWIGAALLCALALRLFRLDAAAIWLDEIDTAIWATLSTTQLAETVFQRATFGNDPRHLPLYFLIVNAWTKVAGLSPWLLRLPSVALSLATVGLTAALGRAVGGVRVGRWAAWLAAISPFLVHHGQEARMYALLAALAAASMLLLVRYLNGMSDKLGWMFVLSNLALMLTHYYAVFLIGAELLLLLYFHRIPARNWVPAWLGSASFVALICYVALFLTTHETGEIYPVSFWAVPGVVWALLTGYGLLPSSEQLHEVGLAAVGPYSPYAVVGVVSAAALLTYGLLGRGSPGRGAMGVVLVAIVLGPFLVSAIFPKISLNPRYFAAGAPLFLVLLGAGMPQLRAAWWHWAAGVALVVLMGLGTVIELGQPGIKREDVFAAGAWLDQNVPPEEEILVTSDEMATIAAYHWPERNVRLYPASRVKVTAENLAAVTKSLPVPDVGRRIYVFGRSWVSDPTHALENFVTRFASCGRAQVRGIRIYCLQAPSFDPSLHVGDDS